MEISLKDFVRETINEVIEGIVCSQKDMVDKYANATDPNITIAGGGYSKIEFDVSVESSKAVEKEGKAGVSIKVIDVGGKAKESVGEKAENRIKFSVLISVGDVNNHPSTRH